MEVVEGTDASASPGGLDRLLAGIRRFLTLADGAQDAEPILRALAGELLADPGAEEVHIHRLDHAPGEDLVAVYLLEGHSRVGYLQPRTERPPGVSWVASTARSFLAADGDELASTAPRLAATGEMSCALLLPVVERAEVVSVVVLVRRAGAVFAP